MTADLHRLNSLSAGEAEQVFFECCGSTRWARLMAGQRPFASFETLRESAERIWFQLHRIDWLEAFRHHPKIGERSSARNTTARTQRWSEQEQAAVTGTREDVLTALAEANRTYEKRFGHIFIVCASGKTSEEMLALLRSRLQNDADRELRIAAEEQQKITQLRLEKLLNPK